MTLPTDPLELCALLGRRLDGALGYIGRFESYYEGTQASSFASPESLAAMNGRMPTFGVNFSRLAILSLAERLRLTGFLLDGVTTPDADVWDSWTRSGMDLGSDRAHVDALIMGRSYVIVWTDDVGDPQLSAESARYCTTISDPVTGRAIVGLKRWFEQPDPDTPLGRGFQVLMTGARLMTFATDANVPISGYPPTGASWRVVEDLPNPCGVPPIVCLRNGYGRRVGNAIEGESELSDLMPLVDGINKLGQDQLVSSEVAARPRRWATGLELVEQRDPKTGQPMTDADGAPVYVNPFSSDATRLWQAESADAKFGAFPAADLSSYNNAIALLTSQVGALSGLPPAALGQWHDAPPSADSLRAAESSLTSRAMGKARMFSPSWAEVAALEVSLRTGRDPRSVKVIPQWADPSTRTPDQSADDAVKLGSLGVPLSVLLRDVLGWSEDQVAAARTAAVQHGLDAAAMNAATGVGAP